MSVAAGRSKYLRWADIDLFGKGTPGPEKQDGRRTTPSAVEIEVRNDDWRTRNLPSRHSWVVYESGHLPAAGQDAGSSRRAILVVNGCYRPDPLVLNDFHAPSFSSFSLPHASTAGLSVRANRHRDRGGAPGPIAEQQILHCAGQLLFDSSPALLPAIRWCAPADPPGIAVGLSRGAPPNTNHV